MYFIYVLGTAGSGKSHLTQAFAEWIESHELSVAKVNLDPAAEWLPYDPDVDVRSYVSTRRVMEEYELGPNGALIASIDMIASKVDYIREEVLSTRANYVIVDTPGQLELFAFRRSGPLIARALSEGFKAVSLYLIDSFFVADPASFASALLLSASTQLRLGMPQVNVLSKCDLISSSSIDKAIEWAEEPLSLISELIGFPLRDATIDLAVRLTEVLRDLQGVFQLVPTSSKTWEGLDDLYRIVQLVLAGGEDYLTEEPSGRL